MLVTEAMVKTMKPGSVIVDLAAEQGGNCPLTKPGETIDVNGVKIVGTFPEDSHPPITYPIALTKTSANPDARAFLSYVRSPAARPAFERQGFTVLRPGGA